MTNPQDDESSASPTPDAAFSVLGNETRVEILQALGEADDVLPFSDLRDRVGTRDSGQFNYHLEKLVGHFVRKTDDGYELRRAGERVIEAVLSGAVTEAPVLEPTPIDQPCEYCGAPVGVTYRGERLVVFCTECQGVYGEQSFGSEEYGLIGSLYLPPAGVQGRSADGILHAAQIWGGLATLAASSGVCPRCSATLEEDVSVCEDHDGTDDVCEACGRRYAVSVRFRCTNCIYERAGAIGVTLLTETAVLEFLTSHGIDPISPSSETAWRAAIGKYDEEVVSADPLEARLTFAVDDDELTLTVDDDLSVVDVSLAERADDRSASDERR